VFGTYPTITYEPQRIKHYKLVYDVTGASIQPQLGPPTSHEPLDQLSIIYLDNGNAILSELWVEYENYTAHKPHREADLGRSPES